ncbi:hypothetical protein MHYP_G00072160 [Metynnis hypsauchen]
MWRFVLGKDKRFGTAWDAFPQEAGNNAKMPMKGADGEQEKGCEGGRIVSGQEESIFSISKDRQKNIGKLANHMDHRI